MKKLIYLFLLILAVSSCKDEETTFQPTVGTEAFSFKPTAGGAVMHYQFPVDNDLMGLNIRYKDYAGKEIVRTGSAQCDSLVIEGFNQAQQNVQAEVRFVKRNGEESSPIPVSFSTEDSAPYAFFDKVKVLSGWNGFSVVTNNRPSNSRGLAHIYYLGTDPLSGQPDTILLNTLNITEGCDTLNFQLKQKSDLNTIIIRTEDYRGYMVREEKWENVASYNTARLAPQKFDFYCEKGIEDETRKLGVRYLFDGELKGIGYFQNIADYDKSAAADMYDFFMAGPDAFGEPMYIDMHENKITAEVRLYTPLYLRYDWSNKDSNPYCMLFRNGYYVDKLPCDVDVYAAKDDHGSPSNWNAKKWMKVASYSQDPNISTSLRWNAAATGWRNKLNSAAEVEKADSVFMSLKLLCDGQEDGYRYLKIVVNKTYNDIDNGSAWLYGTSMNSAKYFLIQEMEVWTKKED